ncbi:hypothetical protein [Rhodococcus sp. X156]|uniref:hypothetical protein n=1 Tax=Rhodococcus sp. X156 TaxID=2499145 RepID=UPI000FD7CE99|nr:hypothetical protein [Rhodococcus sp. X156]
MPDASDAGAWLNGRLPAEWFTGAPTVTVDREEILVVGELDAPDLAERQAAAPGAADPKAAQAAAEGRMSRFREDTRGERMAIAAEAEARYGRTLSWGVRIGDVERLFTHLSVPVMTRLRQPERQVLDTLVDAGIARSRSDAVVWAVRLVAEHTDDWLEQLREAMSTVDKLRAEGPQ